MIKQKILTVFTIFFSVFGILMCGSIIHENIHKIDLKEIVAPGTDEICYLSLQDGYIGYYTFDLVKPIPIKEFKELEKKSEYYAWGFQFAFYSMIIILYCRLRGIKL